MYFSKWLLLLVVFTLCSFEGPAQINHMEIYYHLQMPSLSLAYFSSAFFNLNYPLNLLPLGFFLLIFVILLSLLLRGWVGG